MAKKDRHQPRPAYATLRDLPGTRLLFWVVDACPYCGERHLHIAGNLRTVDPGESLGEYPAPCQPEKTYELTLPPRTRKEKGLRKARRTRWDDEDW